MSFRLPRIAERVWCEPWLILPATHEVIRQALADHQARVAPRAFLDGLMEAPPKLEAWTPEGLPGVRVVPIKGILGRGLSNLEMNCGGQDMERVGRLLDEVRMDESVDQVILDIDSPGGTSMGTPELAAKVRQLADVHPVTAYTSGLMASAAYQIGSQADQVMASTSSRVGSIGVYAALLDTSRALEAQGVKVELIKAGKLKAIGHPGVPLSEAERAHLQEWVDREHAQFKEAVSVKRPAVPAAAMEGQTFDGPQAVAMGLADAVVDSLEEVIARVAAG